jgi:DNA-binding LacI/PurR family transcriptional regulator
MLAKKHTKLLYEKIKDQLLNYIDLKKPHVLPREKDLMIHFGVSRNTLRRAMSDLTKRGIIKPVQGVGSIVMRYSKDRVVDIGVVCTNEVDMTDPWVAIILKTLQQAAHDKGYHLNLFFCHDYSISGESNSAYSYLINSGKLRGLVLMDLLKHSEISYLNSLNVPIVTIDFKYLNWHFPALFANCIPQMEKFIDEHIRSGRNRFGLIAKSIDATLKNNCYGFNDFIIEHWTNILKDKNLPVVEHNFELVPAMQLKAMYALPKEERPQVIFTPYIAYAAEVEAALATLTDWAPAHIVTEIAGYETGIPAIVINPALHVQQALTILDKNIENRQLAVV